MTNEVKETNNERADLKQPGCIFGWNIGPSSTTSLWTSETSSDVIHTKVMPNAEYHSDYHLVRFRLRLHFKPKPIKGPPPKKKFNLNKLQSATKAVCSKYSFPEICILAHSCLEINKDYHLVLCKGAFETADDPFPETHWDQLKSDIVLTSEEVLGFIA